MDVNQGELVGCTDIREQIYSVRSKQVMLDSELAVLYGVETKNLNRAVKRNIERFPEAFRFQLARDEWERLRFHSGTLEKQESGTSGKRGLHRKYLPYVFTEQGIAMLSAVLKSDMAIMVSVQIMNAFVEMRRFLLSNAQVFRRLDSLEVKQLEHDRNFQRVFNALEQKNVVPESDVFFDGQVFDAYVALSKIIRSARTNIDIIDNYIDETVLTLLAKRRKDVSVTLHTRSVSRQMQLDIDKYNSQYPSVTVKELKTAHDRFIIVDGKTVYHVGASLKDLGRKWFAFSRMDKEGLRIVDRISRD